MAGTLDVSVQLGDRVPTINMLNRVKKGKGKKIDKIKGNQEGKRRKGRPISGLTRIRSRDS